MPYVGGKLSDLVGAVQEVTPWAACDIADAGGAAMTRLAALHTPLGPGTDYGHVRSSWRQKPVRRTSRLVYRAYESGVESHHYRAPWVEWGVEPHRIEPEDAEAIETPEGPRAGAEHPGYGGAHPVHRAVFELEATLPELLAPELEAWAKAAELNAKRRPGIS